MRKLFLLIVLALCEIPFQTNSQPLKIDLTVGNISGTDLLLDNWGSYASQTNGTLVNARISYTINSVGIAPLINVCYNFPLVSPDPYYVHALVLTSKGIKLDAGIEKSFRISYSLLNASIGIGYDWQSYKGERPYIPLFTFTNNDIEYWGGLSLYLPFVKGIDLTLGYRLDYKKKHTIDEQVSNTRYHLETADLRNMFTLGISFSFMKKKESKWNIR